MTCYNSYVNERKESGLKVIFVVSALHGGGAERVVVTLANIFSRHGDEVIVLMCAGTEQAYKLDPAVKAVSIGDATHKNPLLQIRRIYRMHRFFKEHPEHKIVSFSTTINMFTIAASCGLRNRVIVSERNDPNQYSHKKIRNFIYSFGKGFVFQTEDAKNCFSKKIRDRSRVIPNPLRKELPLPLPQNAEREKKIAAVGRLEAQKNQMLLLKAFAEFQHIYTEYELHIFGKGKLEEQLKKEALRLGISKNVVFEGFQKDVLEKIRTYGMYILSSDYEGISNSLMEAMAVGLPCISTDCPIGGSRLCIENGQNGILVPVGNAKALKTAMCQVAQALEMGTEQLGEKAVAIRERFSEEQIARLWRDYIRER